MPDLMITMILHTQRHLGRQLAALYESLPPPPIGSRLAALVRRLEAKGQGAPAEPSR